MTDIDRNLLERAARAVRETANSEYSMREDAQTLVEDWALDALGHALGGRDGEARALLDRFGDETDLDVRLAYSREDPAADGKRTRTLREDALELFRTQEPPASLAWADGLGAFHQRLFAVDLADALKIALIRNDDKDLEELIEGWEATADILSSPEMTAEILRPKRYRPLSDFVDVDALR